MSLTVAYVTETGHVLGALATSGPVAAGDPFGAAFPLWVPRGDGAVVDLAVPAARLSVAAVDDDPGVLVAPRDYGVRAQGGGLQPLAPWSDAIDLTAEAVTVTVPRPVPVAAAVLVVVAGGPLLTGEIPAGDDHTAIGARFGEGPHGVLVLVAGWVGRLELVEGS
jgi:hypothetical protein